MVELEGIKRLVIFLLISFTFVLCASVFLEQRPIDKRPKRSNALKIIRIVICVIVFTALTVLHLLTMKTTSSQKEIKKISILMTYVDSSWLHDGYYYYRLKVVCEDGTEIIIGDVKDINYKVGENGSCLIMENGIHMKEVYNLVLTQSDADYLEFYRAIPVDYGR